MTTGAHPSKRFGNRTAQARALRQRETEPEFRLWSDLRNRLLNGFKFIRQAPIGPYVVDFLCRDRHLVVELDGGHHAENGHDLRRTEWLNMRGYSVLRFWNDEVLNERHDVLETIVAVLEGRITEKTDRLRFHPATAMASAAPKMQSLGPNTPVTAALQLHTE